MRLRHRPWKFLALLVFSTAAMVLFGVDLLDGQIETRRYFTIVIGYLVCCGVIIVGWIALYSE